MQDNGTGYLNEEVDDTTGVARTSSATEGYGNQPDMFQSMQMQNGNGNSPFEMLPVNTGDKFVDEYNAMTNNIQAGRIAGINRMNYEFMFNSDFGGHGFTPYRDGMDQYMLDEYGRSKYDSSAGFNTMTKEAVKRHRADEQTNFVILANGLPRLGGRALATVGSLFGGMLQGLTNAFGGSEFVDEHLSPHAFATYGDEWAEFMNENVPVYSSQEDEDYKAEHPLFGMFSTGQGGADMIDNIGFTIGAVVGMRLAGSAGAAVSTGVAVQQLGTAIYKQIDSDTFDANAIIPLTMEVLGGAAGVGVLKAVPKAWREQIGMLSAGVISAVGEAEVEAAHAKKEFIDAKTAGINALNEQFKQESEARIRKEAMEASDKAYKESMALKDDESVARFNAGLAYNDVMKKLDKETAVANWDAIQAKNKVVQEAEKVSNLTRTLNIAILSLSNTLQFGKLMTGGLKTYRTMTNMSVRKEANKFAEAVYKSQLNSAKTAAERQAVKNNKDSIIASALRKWQNANPNTKLFDTNRSLTAKDVAAALGRTAITEGTEEMTQRMSSDAAKAKGEWVVDDYYQGLTNREAIRKAESSTMAAVNAALNCLTDESAWSEFAAGALMGVLGVPWLRSAKASRTTRGEEGTMTTTSHYRSPIFLQGGIYGELTKMMQERKDMAAMSERLNEAFTEKGIERLRDSVNRIAKHMQYEEDKKMFVEQWGSRYDFENAEDADILNFVELFQNSNQMPVLRGLVMSMYNYDSIDDLLQLQQSTNEVEDGTGNVTGPYSGFNISHIDENSSDQQREYVESEADRMREKIKENAERILNTINTYEKARKELDWETNQGLTNKQLNCLAWYKTRMGMFDERSKSMYAASGNFFELLRSNIDNIKKDYLYSMDVDLAALDKEYENAKDEDSKNKLDAQRQNYKKSKELFEEGFDELKKRLDESAELDDDIKKVRLLFAGNVNAQPQTRTASEYLAYMLTGRFTPEMAAWNRSNYVTGIALGMIRMSVKGETNTDENKKQFVSGVLDTLLTQEGYTESDRTNIDEYLRDIQRCQDAVLRFKDKYQLYKDNPYLMDAAETAMHEAERKAVATAERAEMHEAVGECKSVAELYDKIFDLIVKGEDANTINDMLNEMVSNGDAIAIQLMKNQIFIKAFASALKDVIVMERVGKKVNSLAKSVILQCFIKASKVATSHDGIISEAKRILSEITESEDNLVKFIFDEKLVTEKDNITPEELRGSFEYFKNGDKKQLVTSDTDAKTTIRKSGDILIDAAIDRVRHKMAVMFKYDNKKPSDVEIADNSSKITSSLGGMVSPRKAEGVIIQNVLSDVSSEEALITKRGDSYTGQTGSTQSSTNQPSTEATGTANTTPVSGTTTTTTGTTGSTTTQTSGNASQSTSQSTNKTQTSTPSNNNSTSTKTNTTPVGGSTETNNSNNNAQGGTSTKKQKGNTQQQQEEEEDEENVDEVSNPPEEEQSYGNGDADINSENSDVAGLVFPAMSYFNLDFRKNGRYVPNNRVVFDKSSGNLVVRLANTGEASWCEDFFATYNNLGVFDYTDKASKTEIDALVGREVFFVVDEVEKGKDKSKYLGLRKEQLSFNGEPIIWMCVRRPDGTMQCVGSMFTARNKLEQHGLASLHDDIIKGAAANKGKAYIHGVSAPIEKIMHGSVQTVAKNEPRISVEQACGGVNGVHLAVNFKKDDEDQIVTSSKNVDGAEIIGNVKPGILHLLVHDSVSGKYIPMQCHVARFTKEDGEKLSQTDAWKRAERAIAEVVNAAKKWKNASESEKEEALKNFTLSYADVGYILALKGHNVHFDVGAASNGEPYVRISRRLRDNAGNFIKTEDGKYKREHIDVYVGTKEDYAINKLKEALFSYGVPFRITADMLVSHEEDGESSELSTLIRDGFITSDVQNGENTVGSYVVVNPKNTKKSSKPNEERRAESSGRKYKKMIVGGLEIEVELSENKDKFKISISADSSRSVSTTGGLNLTDNDMRLLASAIIEECDGGAGYAGTRNYSIMSRTLDEGGFLGYDSIYIYDKKEHRLTVIPYSLIVEDNHILCQLHPSTYWRGDSYYEAMNGLNSFSDMINILFGDKYSEMTSAETNNPYATVRRSASEHDFVKEMKFLRALEKKIQSINEKKSAHSKEKAIMDVIESIHNRYNDALGDNSTQNVVNQNEILSNFEVKQALEKLFMIGLPSIDSRQENGADILFSILSIPYQYLHDADFGSLVDNNSLNSAYDRMAEDLKLSKDTIEFIRKNKLFSGRASKKSLKVTSNDASSKKKGGNSKAKKTASQEAANETAREQEKRAAKEDERKKMEKEARYERFREETKDMYHIERYDIDPNDIEDVEDIEIDDSKFSMRSEEDYKSPQQDVEREAEAVRKMMPSMTRDGSIQFVEGLFEVGRKGEYAQGVFMDGKIIISDQAVRGTVFHEGFHMVFSTALRQSQRDDLLNDVRRVLRKEVSNYEAEEVLCDWFRDYMVDQVYEKSWTRKIKDFFRMLFHIKSIGYESLDHLSLNIFLNAKNGRYDKLFCYSSTYDERVLEYKSRGMNWDEVDAAEDYRSSYEARTEEEKDMLREAGITQFEFDLLSPKSREEIIECL